MLLYTTLAFGLLFRGEPVCFELCIIVATSFFTYEYFVYRYRFYQQVYLDSSGNSISKQISKKVTITVIICLCHK